ncbi:conserved hypothetical protein [Talaromyces stipitatus ATCC 10500]|uniref:CFEM domain-containing protein n=1 Tax=Talaromyces stipitatus (strain ATCC 10500 / CBS 375.48 / QM 6759 / NRRL 1006) TaxID=441959 RepID=B8MPE9_TALSN|nr:uncharacterized protein TSTA_105970 [Talaromyces stipitatus ATCC 10500]EED14388.1 conserved hypothetical protein [Talaromyces stipitatus ATCC 10500]
MATVIFFWVVIYRDISTEQMYTDILSMLASCPLWRSSVFLVSLAVSRGLGQTTTAAAYCSPSTSSGYLSTIPSCALYCVQDFIRTQYAGTCCSGSLDCLCRTNTTSGLTLGEGALACIVGSCSSEIISTAGSAAYEICSDVSGALPETHAAITATRVSVVTETTHLVTTTSVGSTAPATSVLVTSTPKSSLVTTKTTTVPSTITMLPATTITTSTTTTRSTSTSTTSAAAAAKSSLSSPAVIGVSIASGVSAIFLMVVAMILCGRRLRRRKLRQAAPQSFEIGGEMSEPPDFTAAVVPQLLPPTQPSHLPRGTTTDMGAATGPNFHQFPPHPVREQGPLVILTQSSPANGNANTNQAMSPETEYNASPQSQTSQRTISRLLPEGTARQGIVPEPLRVIRQPAANTIRVVGGPRPASEATVIDEDESQPSSNSTSTRNNIFGPPLDKLRRASRGSPMRVVGLPAGPRAMLSPLRTRQQNPYDSGNSYKWDKEAVPIPASRSPGSSLSPAEHVNEARDWGKPQRNFSRLGRGPRSLTTPTRTNPNTPWSRNTLSRNGFEVAPVDSSYETIMYEDDYTMADRSKLSIPRQSQQQQQQRLSPVSERIPLPTKSPLRYPAIPLSAAIVPATAQGMRKSHVAEVYYDDSHEYPTTVPPIPPPESNPIQPKFIYELGTGQRSRSASPTPSSPSSLLAKRRGESVADKMETEFRSGVQPKPGVGRKVVVTRNNTDEGIQSPPSAKKHNITPTRRGEDLYLRVD